MSEAVNLNLPELKNEPCKVCHKYHILLTPEQVETAIAGLSYTRRREYRKVAREIYEQAYTGKIVE